MVAAIVRIREQKRAAAEAAEAARLAEIRREQALVAHVALDVLDNIRVKVRGVDRFSDFCTVFWLKLAVALDVPYSIHARRAALACGCC